MTRAEAILPRAGLTSSQTEPILRPGHQQEGKRGPRGRTHDTTESTQARVHRSLPSGSGRLPGGLRGLGSAGLLHLLCLPTNAETHRAMEKQHVRKEAAVPPRPVSTGCLCPPAPPAAESPRTHLAVAGLRVAS